MNELDKIFRSKLENHTEEYSSQAWNNIQSRLIQQKTNPKKFPWLWMSLVPLIIGGIVFLLVSSSNSDLQTIPTNDTTIAIQQDSDQTGDRQNPGLIASVIDKKTSFDKVADAELETVDTYASNEIDEVAKDNSIEKEDSNNQTHATNWIANTDESATLENQLKEKGNRLSNDALENSIESNVLNVEEKESIDVELSKISDFNTSIGVSNSTVDINLSDVRDLEDSDLLIDIRPLRTIGVSSFTKLFSVEDQEDIELSKSLMDDFRQDCPSFVTDRTGVYLDFYVSHELPFSSLTAKDAQSEPYQALRAETEGPSYSFSAGARLTLMLPNGLGLKTGINYSQVNEKFSYVDPESVMNKQVITITNVDGMEIRDTNYIEIPGTREIVSTNKYRSFDLPLLLSYEWDVRERTYMTVNGGVYLNLLFKETGKILDSGGEVIDIGGDSGDGLAIFKNNIGLSLFGSVGLHYRWNSSIDFILEPNARLLVKSATVEGHPISHKWITGGLITGMRYNF